MIQKIKKILSKKNKTKIICLTAYSKNFATEVDKFADITLVGDSLGSVLYNYETTRKVTLNNMIEHIHSFHDYHNGYYHQDIIYKDGITTEMNGYR